MKKTLLFILLLITGNTLNAQDLIINNLGDSLECKITKVDSTEIYLTLKFRERARGTLIKKRDVKAFEYGYYTKKKIIDDIQKYQKLPSWRYGLNIGFGYQIDRTLRNADEFQRFHMNGLRSGFVYGADVIHYLNDKIGIGGKFTGYKAGQSTSAARMINGSLKDFPSATTKLSINFYAPYLNLRFPNKNKKNIFMLGYAIGFLSYKNNSQDTYYYNNNMYSQDIYYFGQSINSNEISSINIGMGIDLGYDFFQTKNFAWNFQLSYLGGKISPNSINGSNIGLEKEKRENLNRLDLTIGVKFHKH